jgi:hypothetical protein
VTLVFRSKVDGKLTAVGLAMPLVALLALATTPTVQLPLLWLPVLATAGVAVIVVWVVLSTYYAFELPELVVRCGPFAWRVPLRDISAARESTSTRSGPALSMDRIEITYGAGRVLLISPADKAGFLAALRRHAPQLGP